MKKAVYINGQQISSATRPFLIAEISANHNGSIERAKALIKSAQENGADAVKLQTYKPETITLKQYSDEFLIKDGQFKGQYLYDLYEKAHLPWEWHAELFQFSSDIGITIFSTPFDETAVDFLESLKTPAYKIASFELTDLPLIKKVAGTLKPVILSTGMASLSEISRSVDVIRSTGNEQIIVLRCVSGYPSASSDYNLATIPKLEGELNCWIGLSDHTLNNTTAIVSVGMGTVLIEKHFTLDRNGGGPDDSFSMEPKDLFSLRQTVDEAYLSVGKTHFGTTASDEKNKQFRRSLYFIRDLKRGHSLTETDVKSVRPGFGLPPDQLDLLIGCSLKEDVEKNTPVSLDQLEI